MSQSLPYSPFNKVQHNSNNQDNEISNQMIADRSAQVFKIGQAVIPDMTQGNCTPLPESANLPRVIGNIFNTLRIVHPRFQNRELANMWKSYFQSDECLYIISDFFWLSIIKLDKQKTNPNAYKIIEQELSNRISYNYVQLFVKIQKQHKEIFFGPFYDCLAQAIFYSMFFAYPKSRSELNSDQFKHSLYELISKQITGITVRNNGFKSWILDLGAGNVLERSKSQALEKTKQQKLPTIKLRQDISRKSFDIRYSTLINRYLHLRKYEALNAIRPWNMRFTLRNLQKEEEVDKKFHNYRKLAIQAEERAIKREVEYNDFSEAIDQKIQKNHDAYILHARRLKKYTEKIMSEDPHEYANKLISMDKYLQQKDKAYNI